MELTDRERFFETVLRPRLNDLLALGVEHGVSMWIMADTGSQGFYSLNSLDENSHGTLLTMYDVLMGHVETYRPLGKEIKGE